MKTNQKKEKEGKKQTRKKRKENEKKEKWENRMRDELQENKKIHIKEDDEEKEVGMMKGKKIMKVTQRRKRRMWSERKRKEMNKKWITGWEKKDEKKNRSREELIMEGKVAEKWDEKSDGTKGREGEKFEKEKMRIEKNR